MIPLARPSIGDGELAAAERALRSGRLVLGPENLRFEELLAARCRRRHAIATASGTAALELALWAIGIGPGDEVLVTAFGFPAAANAVRRAGATPVPVDVDGATWTVDLAAVRAALTGWARVRALVSIDQLGLPAEADALDQLERDSGLPVVNDAACGLGAVGAGGAPGGAGGQLAVLSFHPRKLITTGEGGALLTDDDDLALAARELRNHGQEGPGRFARIGTNARMSEVAAAIGSAQMARLDDMLAERRLLADGYRRRLAALARAGRLSLQEPAPGAMHAYQTFAVRLAAGIDRDRVRRALAAAGIESGPATFAFNRVGPHHELVDPAPPTPEADALHERALALPLYIGMRSAELDAVAAALSAALADPAADPALAPGRGLA